MYLCVRCIDFVKSGVKHHNSLLFPTNVLLDFGTLLTVFYFVLFILLRYNFTMAVILIFL